LEEEEEEEEEVAFNLTFVPLVFVFV